MSNLTTYNSKTLSKELTETPEQSLDQPLVLMHETSITSYSKLLIMFQARLSTYEGFRSLCDKHEPDYIRYSMLMEQLAKIISDIVEFRRLETHSTKSYEQAYAELLTLK